MHLIAQKCILLFRVLQSRKMRLEYRRFKEKKVWLRKMKIILHDLDRQYDGMVASKCDRMIAADGKYAPCQGCFGCWTRHPAECAMKDKLKQACRVVGQADELVIVT